MEKFYRVQGRGLPWGKISHFMWNDIKSVDAPLLGCASCGIPAGVAKRLSVSSACYFIPKRLQDAQSMS